MKTLTTLEEKIVHREKIELGAPMKASTVLSLLSLFIVVCLTAELLILTTHGINFAFILATAFFISGLLFFLSTLWKSMATAYIKGEMLIVRFLFDKPKITCIDSIRDIRSLNWLGIRFTTFRFNVDGRHHKVILYGIPDYLQDPKTVIETVVRNVA